jgi:hypothetical protein
MEAYENKLKFCTGCKEKLGIALFHKNKARNDGLCNRCKDCDRKRKKDPRNKEYQSLYAKKYQKEEKSKEYHRKYYADNKEKYVSSGKKWRSENVEKQKELWRKHTKTEEWRKRHKINEANRRISKINTKIDGFDSIIKDIYDNCPIGYQVDHIVPLRGKTVCGLHVPWNMQYLESEVNFKKNNKLEDNCLQIPSLYETFKVKDE